MKTSSSILFHLFSLIECGAEHRNHSHHSAEWCAHSCERVTAYSASSTGHCSGPSPNSGTRTAAAAAATITATAAITTASAATTAATATITATTAVAATIAATTVTGSFELCPLT